MQTYMQYDNLDIYDPAAILTYLLPNYYYDYYYRYHEYERFLPKLYKVLDSTKEAEILVHSMVFESPPPCDSVDMRSHGILKYVMCVEVNNLINHTRAIQDCMYIKDILS